MPRTPDTEPVSLRPRERYQFSVEPAQNVLYSFFTLNAVETLPGLHEWVERTADRLSPEQLHRNRIVLDGLHYATFPERSYPSFMAYLQDLAAADPYALRDQLLDHLLKYCLADQGRTPRPVSREELLVSVDVYLDYLRAYLPNSKWDEEIEAEAYALMQEPPLMHEVMLGHLRMLWNDHMATEWGRARPLLNESIAAFRAVDFRGRAPYAVAEAVIGHPPDEKTAALIEGADQIIFVPSPHLGPYLTKLAHGPVLRLLFGARLPAGAEDPSSELSRSDLLVRLGALTDDTRLQVLRLLARNDDLCAPDLMLQLDLSQSAVSRHLRQLVAAGYVSERWRDGSKCYRLNRPRVSDTLRALEYFLA